MASGCPPHALGLRLVNAWGENILGVSSSGEPQASKKAQCAPVTCFGQEVAPDGRHQPWHRRPAYPRGSSRALVRTGADPGSPHIPPASPPALVSPRLPADPRVLSFLSRSLFQCHETSVTCAPAMKKLLSASAVTRAIFGPVGYCASPHHVPEGCQPAVPATAPFLCRGLRAPCAQPWAWKGAGWR